MFEEIKRHEDCTVIICRDSETGDIDIAWYDNKRPPALIITEQEEEDDLK